MQDIFIDAAAAGLGALILAGYHGWLLWRVRRQPAYTVQSIHALARSAWVESVMKNGRDILAVQTLRNSTMAATFLASTAILLIVGVLTLSGQSDKLEIAWNALNSFHATDPSLWLIKLLALIVDLSFAFFSFTLAIRKFHHVGYLLNVPEDGRHPLLTPAYVAAYLNRAGSFYTLGMRAYYFLLPLVFWLFGPVLMVVASVALVAILYRLDRAGYEMEAELTVVPTGEPPPPRNRKRETRVEPIATLHSFEPEGQSGRRERSRPGANLCPGVGARSKTHPDLTTHPLAQALLRLASRTALRYRNPATPSRFSGKLMSRYPNSAARRPLYAAPNCSCRWGVRPGPPPGSRCPPAAPMSLPG